MRFVDSAAIKVIAGAGGNGCVAFRREKFIPFGGPSGGDGGDGGSVLLEGDLGMSTLLDFKYQRTLEAGRGEHGMGSDCYGKKAADKIVRVPVGTQIFDVETGALLADVTEGGQRVVVAKGGRGGRGNIHFATSTDRAPRRADRGAPGELRELRLELKVLADVGLLGFPNVGKSTFVAAISAARPKVADYPFTTLTPTLGMVEVGAGRKGGGAAFVIADIPGLVPGASEGRGLGTQFLRHVERTRALLHLVTLDPGEGREPLADYKALRKELRAFRSELSDRPEIVALSKGDLTEVREAFPALEKKFARAKVELHLVSAATGEGMRDLVDRLAKLALARVEAPAPEAATSKPRKPEDREVRSPAKPARVRSPAKPAKAPVRPPAKPAKAPVRPPAKPAKVRSPAKPAKAPVRPPAKPAKVRSPAKPKKPASHGRVRSRVAPAKSTDAPAAGRGRAKRRSL